MDFAHTRSAAITLAGAASPSPWQGLRLLSAWRETLIEGAKARETIADAFVCAIRRKGREGQYMYVASQRSE